VEVVKYPHPTLRHRSKPLRRVDAELRRMIEQMFDLLYEHNGVGLAANQVDLPYRFFVLNLTGDPDARDEELVFINPVIEKHKGSTEKEEGCLSFPGIWAPVIRSERVLVRAYNLKGQEVCYELDDLAARAVQHETDHLDGVLFIDRLSESNRLTIKDQLAALERQFREQRRRGKIGDDAAIAARLAQLEEART